MQQFSGKLPMVKQRKLKTHSTLDITRNIATLAREQRNGNSALENRQKKTIIYYCKSKNLMAY